MTRHPIVLLVAVAAVLVLPPTAVAAHDGDGHASALEGASVAQSADQDDATAVRDGKASILESVLESVLPPAVVAVQKLAQLAAPSTPLAPSDNVEYVDGSNDSTGGHVMTRGDRLYVGAYGGGMRIFDISDPEAPEQIGSYRPGLRADAVPEAREFDGRHLAALNGTRRVTRPDSMRTDRTEFLDVTDPAEPVLLAEFVGADDGEAHNGDFAVGKRLWLPSGGSGDYGEDGGRGLREGQEQGPDLHRGLRIYDLAPTIDTDAEACTAGEEDNPCAPQLIFAADPVELWRNSPFRRGRDVGHDFTHTHDITIYEDHPVAGLGKRDIILLAEGGAYLNDAGETGSAFVIDITDPTDPVVLLRWIHDSSDGHDPIRYYHEAQLLDGDPRVMIVTDEDLHGGCGQRGGATAVRLSADLTEATELSDWFIPAGTPAPVCSVHVFTSHGYLVFFGSYNAGLQVVDYSDPTEPRQVGSYLAEGTTAWGAEYFDDGIVYSGDMTRGLDVLRYVGPMPDLAISDDDVHAEARGNGPVTVTATVRNLGEVAAPPVLVRFTDEDGATIDERTIPRLGAGELRKVSTVWKRRGAGNATITVTADPDDVLDEADEGNNDGSVEASGRSRKGQGGRGGRQAGAATFPAALTPAETGSFELALRLVRALLLGVF